MERLTHEPEIIYNRGGNLAAVTQLDGGKAYEYMRRTDMRRWIIIADSDEKPQGQATQVGSDVLAWRRIVPINELLSTRFRPRLLHTLTRDDAGSTPVWQIAVHERVIDKQIRDGHFIDRSDYETQFLQKLNKAVKSGLLEALRREKLGWHDQGKNYIGKVFEHLAAFGSSNIAYLSIGDNLITNIYPYWLFLSIALDFQRPHKSDSENLLLYDGPNLFRIITSVKHIGEKRAAFPAIPFPDWFRGKAFLARNGHQMIVPSK